jgi:hypothetical protein
MKELQKEWFQKNKKNIYEKTNKRLNDNPSLKFIKNQRRRILLALNNKSMKTINYLGCNIENFTEWLSYNNCNFENHGKELHIDHVIPLYHFDMTDEKQQLIAFNWRNTMPLSAKENLTKNTKIVSSQVEQHYKNLLEYHKKHNIEMPHEFIELFARHLDAGSPLEHSLPLHCGNTMEELG